MGYIHNPTGWTYACIENVIKRKLQLGSRYRYEEEAAAHGTLDGVEDEIYADQLLKDLDPLEKKIVYYIHWEGYTRKEIASLLHLTHANVRQIYSRALKKLRSDL